MNISRRSVLVFGRAPLVGRVKTRLAATIGDEQAASLYAAMLRDCLRLASAFDIENTALAFTPPDAFDDDFESGRHSLRAMWSGARQAQVDGDLGTKMISALNHQHQSGATHVVIIGSDAPDLPLSILDQAFSSLRAADVVFSPAADGGFVLVGTSCVLPATLFENIDWSREQTLQSCLNNAAKLVLSTAIIEGWQDVDTWADLQALHHRLRHNNAAAATRAWLSKYFDAVAAPLDRS